MTINCIEFLAKTFHYDQGQLKVRAECFSWSGCIIDNNVKAMNNEVVFNFYARGRDCAYHGVQ